MELTSSFFIFSRPLSTSLSTSLSRPLSLSTSLDRKEREKKHISITVIGPNVAFFFQRLSGRANSPSLLLFASWRAPGVCRSTEVKKGKREAREEEGRTKGRTTPGGGRRETGLKKNGNRVRASERRQRKRKETLRTSNAISRTLAPRVHLDSPPFFHRRERFGFSFRKREEKLIVRKLEAKRSSG